MRRVQKQTKKKVCFITALYKGAKFEQHDNPPNFEKIEDFDYLLFTNISKEKLNTSWTIIEKDFPEYEDSIIKSRIPKFQAHTLPELEKYDYIIYIDAYFYPIPNKNNWIKLIEKMEKENIKLLQEKNPYRDCAYEECDEIVKLKKDSYERAEKTKMFLTGENLPKKYGLWRNTFLVYNRKDLEVQNFFNEFWKIYYNNELTHRDQPLYMVAVMKTKMKIYEHRISKMMIYVKDAIGKHIYV